MPSSFSTNLKLELMATGEDNNIWGVTTNTNLGTLLEQSIVGLGAVTQADADTTITISNGASSAARCFVLNVTGTTTAQRNLIVPTIQKPYVIANNTTGGFGIQVKTSAGTGIVVPNGTKMFLYVDGTNVVNMFETFATINVTGSSFGIGGFTLTPGGNFTTGGAVTFSGAFSTTLTVTAGTTLTLPTTGTLATLAGSETLSNKTLVAPALGTPASGVLTNCTGYPASGLGGLGTGVGTWLATPSSANLAAAVTDETGSGALVFATSPTLVTPVLGTPASGTLSNCTALPAASVTAGAMSMDSYSATTSNINAQTGTSYTLVNSDNGKQVTLSNAAAITLTVPSGLTAGFSCTLVQLGAGQVTVTASSTTLNNRNGLKTGGQYAVVGVLYGGATNTYIVCGDTST